MKGEEALRRIKAAFSTSDLSNLDEYGGSMESGGLILFDTSWMDKEKLLKSLEREFPE